MREDGIGTEERALAEIARVLRPGGWFFAWNLPTRAAPADLLGKLRGAWHHEHRYGAGQVRGLLRGAGLELVHLERHGGTPIGVALKGLLGPAGAARAFAWDHHLPAVPPFAWLAQNFALAARRPLSKPP